MHHCLAFMNDQTDKYLIEYEQATARAISNANREFNHATANGTLPLDPEEQAWIVTRLELAHLQAEYIFRRKVGMPLELYPKP